MTDKHCKPSVTSGDDRVTAKDAVTECSEDFLQCLDTIPSHPSFIQPLLEQGESEDGRKLLRKIRQDPEWKKRVGKMLSFESHTLKGRLSWEQDKLKEQKKWLSSQKEEGERTHSGQLQQISQLKQELREEMTNRIKLESNLAEDKRINKKLMEDTKKAAKPKQKLSEVLNRTSARENQVSTSPSPSVETVCLTETDELSVHSSSASEKLVLSPSHSERPSSRESTGSRSSRRHSHSPCRTSSKMSYSLSEAISKQPSAAQSLASLKLPKITNSPLISAQEASTPPSSPPLSKETSLHTRVSCEDSVLSIKSKCSHCGVKKPGKSPRDQSVQSGRTQDYQHTPSSFYSHSSAYHRPTLPSHNLHMSSPPVLIHHAPIPYTYLQPCHECVPAPQLHHCHTQHQCSPCYLHKEDTGRFNQEFEHLKEFIREEIRSGWTKSPRNRRLKTYNCSREYAVSETSTTSETDLEDPYVLPSSNASRPGKPYRRRKGQETDSSCHSLAATHSIDSKHSEVSSILEDELFVKLVSNPAKYSYELQEIAKLLTSPPVSRASSTTSRQKLSAIKHLVREAMCSYSTSELDTSDANEEGPHTEESEGNLSRLEHVSSRTIHKARKAKETKGECGISPKPSILKTSSRPSERDIASPASLTGLKRVNFSSETIDIDDGQPTQLNNIPDDYVVVEQDEIALATQEIREAEQTAQELVPDSRSSTQETVPDSRSSTHLAYPYDLYMTGQLAEPYTIVQSLDLSVAPSGSHVSDEGGRVDAASRLLSELGIESCASSKLSVSHSLELKASLPSIPSYISETVSRNSVSSRPNRPVQENDTTPSLLSNSRSSLNQAAPLRDGEDELEAEKRNNRSCQEVAGVPEDTARVEETPELPESHPRRYSRSNSLTQQESLRRSSVGQMSRISLVSRPSFQMNAQQPLAEEMVPPKIEKQTSKSSLASRIFSTFTSIVSLKPSTSKTSVAEQESVHSIASNLSRSAPVDSNESISKLKQNVSHANIDTSTLEKSTSNSSRPVSRQEEIQKGNSSVSKSGSRQEEIQKGNSSVSKSGSRQEEIQKGNSSVSRSGSRQEEIQKGNSSVSKSGSRQEEIQKGNSSVSKSGSRQEEIQKGNSSVSRSGSRQEEIQKGNSSVSRSGSRQEVISTDPPQCECADCPLPTSEGITEAQTDTVTIPDPVSSETDVPVRIVLSPEVETSRNVEESEADMGVVMKFSEEWKIVCTKDCPSGVEETTITDWREPGSIPQALEKSESAPNSRVSSEEFTHDTQVPGIATRSLDSIGDQPNTVDDSINSPVGKEDTVTENTNSPVGKEDTVTENINSPVGKEDTVTENTNSPVGKEDTVTENTNSPVSKEDTVTENINSPVSKEDTVTENINSPVSKEDTAVVQDGSLENNPDETESKDAVEPAEIRSNPDKVDIPVDRENDDVTELYNNVTAQIVTEALERITRRAEETQGEDTPPLETDNGAQESNDNLQTETHEISLPDTKQA